MPRRIGTKSKVRTWAFENGHAKTTIAAVGFMTRAHADGSETAGWVVVDVVRTGFELNVELTVANARALRDSLDAAIAKAESKEPCTRVCYACKRDRQEIG